MNSNLRAGLQLEQRFFHDQRSAFLAIREAMFTGWKNLVKSHSQHKNAIVISSRESELSEGSEGMESSFSGDIPHQKLDNVVDRVQDQKFDLYELALSQRNRGMPIEALRYLPPISSYTFHPSTR